MRIPISETTNGTIVSDGRKWPYLHCHYLFIPDYYPNFHKKIGVLSWAEFKTIGRGIGHIHPRLRRENNQNPAILESMKVLKEKLEQYNKRDEQEAI